MKAPQKGRIFFQMDVLFSTKQISFIVVTNYTSRLNRRQIASS